MVSTLDCDSGSLRSSRNMLIMNKIISPDNVSFGELQSASVNKCITHSNQLLSVPWEYNEWKRTIWISSNHDFKLIRPILINLLKEAGWKCRKSWQWSQEIVVYRPSNKKK